MRDVTQLREASSPDLAARRGAVLVQRYLKPDSPMDIGLDAETKEKLAALADSGDGAAMSEALQETQAAMSASMAESMEALRTQLMRAPGAKAKSKAKMRKATDPSVVGKQRKWVVIIGSGYAGAVAAMKLDLNPLLHVTLVDTKE